MPDPIMTAEIDLELNQGKLRSQLEGVRRGMGRSMEGVVKSTNAQLDKIPNNFVKKFERLSNGAVLAGQQISNALKITTTPIVAGGALAFNRFLKSHTSAGREAAGQWGSTRANLDQGLTNIGRYVNQSKVFGQTMNQWVDQFSGKLKSLNQEDVQKFVNGIQTAAVAMGAIKAATIGLKFTQGAMKAGQALGWGQTGSIIGGDLISDVIGGYAGYRGARRGAMLGASRSMDITTFQDLLKSGKTKQAGDYLCNLTSFAIPGFYRRGQESLMPKGNIRGEISGDIGFRSAVNLANLGYDSKQIAQIIGKGKLDTIQQLKYAFSYQGIKQPTIGGYGKNILDFGAGSKLSRGGSIAGIGLGIAAIAGMGSQVFSQGYGKAEPYSGIGSFFSNSAKDTGNLLKDAGTVAIAPLKYQLAQAMASVKLIPDFLYQVTNYIGSKGSVFEALKSTGGKFVNTIKDSIRPLLNIINVIPDQNFTKKINGKTIKNTKGEDVRFGFAAMTKDEIDAELVKLFAENKRRFDLNLDENGKANKETRRYFETPEGYVDLMNRKREERDKKEERAREFKNEQLEKEWAKNLKSLQGEVFDKNLRKSTIKSLDRMAEDRDYTVASINKQMVDMFYRRQKDGLGSHGTILGGMETPAFSQSYQKEGERARREYNSEMERLQTDQLAAQLDANIAINSLAKKFDKYIKAVTSGLIPEDVAAGVEL